MTKFRSLALALTALLVFAGVAYAKEYFHFGVVPDTYDPAKSFLVEASWLTGIGCPTNATVTYDGSTKSTYTDPACPTGDGNDKRNEGLLLAKTGPTGNYAAAQADIRGFRGPITELGYDIRKPANTSDSRGSHCGAGAPRFNLTAVREKGSNSASTTYFIGCNSPTPAQTSNGSQGWIRLRWGGDNTPLMAYDSTTGVLTNITGMQFESIQIVFDEGQDTGPDNFGLSVLDNIDVNGVLVGQGPHRGQEGSDGD